MVTTIVDARDYSSSMSAEPTTNPVLVEATRGGMRESAHRGAIAVVDADGKRLFALGDIERPVFPRSAVKVLQALPLVASGAADQLGLERRGAGVACASHNGEPEHAAVVARCWPTPGSTPGRSNAARTGPHREAIQRADRRGRREPSALHNNCSGKHAGFLCVACCMVRRRRPAPATRAATSARSIR